MPPSDESMKLSPLCVQKSLITNGSLQVTTYRCLENGSFALLQAYVDEDVRKKMPVPVDANVSQLRMFFL